MFLSKKDKTIHISNVYTSLLKPCNKQDRYFKSLKLIGENPFVTATDPGNVSFAALVTTVSFCSEMRKPQPAVLHTYINMYIM